MSAAARNNVWRDGLAAMCAAGATVCATGFLVASAVGSWAVWFFIARGWRPAPAERRRAPLRISSTASLGTLTLVVGLLALRRMFRAYRRVLFRHLAAPRTPLLHILGVYAAILGGALVLWWRWAPRSGRLAAGVAAGVLVILSAFIPAASAAPFLLPLVLLLWFAVAEAWQLRPPAGSRRLWLLGSLAVAALAVTAIGAFQAGGPAGAWSAIEDLFHVRLLPHGVKELVSVGVIVHLARGGRSDPLLGAACALAPVGFAWAAWKTLPRTPAALILIPLVAALAGRGAQEGWSLRWIVARTFSRNLFLLILLGLLLAGLHDGFNAGTLGP